jgi:SLOG family YspA-like protein/Meiotically Up-regulated Gene 113 (MUG113) protein
MIYFAQNTVTHAVKIGYSNNPQKRLQGLQTATPDKLVLLGTIPGGLEHEAAFLNKFAKYKLKREWFKSDILGEVQQIIAKEAANPQQAKLNVIVWADSDFNRQIDFAWSSDPIPQANKTKGEALVLQALNELHLKNPIGWVITGGDRHLDKLAWQWAKENKVEVYRYLPKWKKYGRSAGFKVGPQLLRSMFDPKLLLVFLANKRSPSSLIRQAEKAGIPVVTKGESSSVQASAANL